MQFLLVVFTFVQDPANEETVKILQALVRIDTQNNPDRGLKGNELALCNEVKGWIEKAGGAADVYETAPGRGCLVARYKGDGSKKPILLMAHVDVVDIEAGKWTKDAMKAEIDADGYLYGRGTIDDKGMAACIVASFLKLLREKPKLTRDVIVLLCADEESGGDHGIKWMVANKFSAIEAEFALNEGGQVIMDESGKVKYVAIQCAEKVMHNARIVVTGKAGHGSVPHADNCVLKLGQVLAKLADYRPAGRVNEVTKGYFEGQATLKGDAKLARDPEYASGLDPFYNALLHSTFTPTILKGGVRFNIIPSEAECTINVRLLPGDDLDEFLGALAAHVGKRDDVRFVPEKEKKEREAEPEPSSPATAMFAALAKVGGELWPEAVVMPMMSTGATDSRDLRLKGIASYGLLTFPITEEDKKRMHGNDERVPARSLSKGTDYLHRVILELGK